LCRLEHRQGLPALPLLHRQPHRLQCRPGDAVHFPPRTGAAAHCRPGTGSRRCTGPPAGPCERGRCAAHRPDRRRGSGGGPHHTHTLPRPGAPRPPPVRVRAGARRAPAPAGRYRLLHAALLRHGGGNPPHGAGGGGRHRQDGGLMRWFRSYVDLPLEPGTLVTLPEANRQHLGRGLRLRDGDAVTLFNGDGYDYPACLTGAGPALGARILSRQPAAAAEARLHLTLVQALARGEKMDWILQKATELGVAAVLPVSTQRCEVRLDGDRAGKRLAHWRQVVASACEQCGRARLPLVAGPQPLSALADAPVPAEEPLRLALDPDGDLTLSDLPL